MFKLNTVVKENKFNNVCTVVNTYPEYDLEGEFTVVVLRYENGETIGVAENIVQKEYTVIKEGEETKEQIVKRLSESYSKVGNIEDHDNALYEESLLEEMEYYNVTDEVFKLMNR